VENKNEGDTEYKMEVILEDPQTGSSFVFCGSFDHILITDDGVRITENKTHVTDKSAKDNFQIQVYAFMYWKKRNIIPEMILKDSKEELLHYPTPEDLKNTEKVIWSLYYDIRSGEFPANSSKYECGRCAYLNVCPLATPIRKGYLSLLES